MKRALTVFLASLALSVAPIGCKRLQEAKKLVDAVQSAASANAPGPGAGRQGSSAASPEEEKDQALGDKLDGYINCLNNVSSRVYQSRDRYLSWVANEKTGPSGKERIVYGLYNIETADICAQGIDKSKAAEPALPDVDGAAASYKAALTALVPVIKKAADYYDQKNYKDDKFKGGKDMHGPLMAAFDAFDQSNKTFSAGVTKINEEIQQRSLARLEKDPSRRLQYLEMKALADGKKLVKLTHVKDLASLDVTTYQAGLDAYDKSLGELDTYADQHKDEAAKVMMFSMFMSEAKAYLKSAKDLARRKREKKDFNKEFFSNSNPSMVDGHPAQIVQKYNSMIQASNNLRF
jgi:hypothetical protein